MYHRPAASPPSSMKPKVWSCPTRRCAWCLRSPHIATSNRATWSTAKSRYANCVYVCRWCASTCTTNSIQRVCQTRCWIATRRRLHARNLANRQARPDRFLAAVQLRTASAQLLVRLVLMCAVPTLPAHPRLQPRDSANCQAGLLTMPGPSFSQPSSDELRSTQMSVHMDLMCAVPTLPHTPGSSHSTWPNAKSG